MLPLQAISCENTRTQQIPESLFPLANSEVLEVGSEDGLDVFFVDCLGTCQILTYGEAFAGHSLAKKTYIDKLHPHQTQRQRISIL